MTSKEETTLMNAGEINSRNKLNATVNNNNMVKGDIDCLIFFNPIDYHNSFDTFNFHSHHMNDFYFQGPILTSFDQYEQFTRIFDDSLFSKFDSYHLTTESTLE